MFRQTDLFNLPPKVFISYSHSDREFVERLASDLIDQSILVWWDEWEIQIGDSLIRKIEEGITNSSYLIIVLSNSSVNSAWVQEELRAALNLQLSEKRTRVLPVLIDECQIPLFLRDKKYADFRKDYDAAIRNLLDAISKPDVKNNGREELKDYHHDYAFEWGLFGDFYGVKIRIISHSVKWQYVINCEIIIVSNREFSKRLEQYYAAGFSWAIPSMLLIQIEDLIQMHSPIILIDGDAEAIETYRTHDPKRNMNSNITVKARRLGINPGGELIYEWGSICRYIQSKHREEILNSVPKEYFEKQQQWLKENPI